MSSPWTPKRNKRRRPFQTPKFTPKSKRKPLYRSTPSKTNNSQKRHPWSDEEKAFLARYVDEQGGKDKIHWSKKYWKKCADQLNDAYNKDRSASSCWNTFKRHISGAEDSFNASTFLDDSSFLDNPSFADVSVIKNTADIGIQTDISIHPSTHYAWVPHSVTKENVVLPHLSTAERVASPAPSILRSLLVDEPRQQSSGTKRCLFPDSCIESEEENSDAHDAEDFFISELFEDVVEVVVENTLSPVVEHNYNLKKKTSKKNKPPRKKKLPDSASSLLHSPEEITSQLYLNNEIKKSLSICIERDSAEMIAEAILQVPLLRQQLVKLFSQEIGTFPEKLKSRKKNPSVLMKKDFDAMSSLDVCEIVAEFKSECPELFVFLLNIMLPPQKRNSPHKLAEAMPRIAMIYSIMLFTRNHMLSRLQRTIAMSLTEHISDQKLYDRLNVLGVSVSYNRSLAVTQEIGAASREILLQAARDGRRIRFIGDNLNFMMGVREETIEKHSHMVHMFASAALLSDHYFMDKPEAPEIPLEQLTIDNILLSNIEYNIIKKDSIKIVADIIAKYLPQMSFFKKCVPSTLAEPECEAFAEKTTVVPLPVLPCNEQCYQDVVKIQDYYESLAREIFQASGNQPRIHIGGDQLTRERFSHATHMRIGNEDPFQRFAHLGPVTMEFFHLGMNYLEKVIFDTLWKSSVETEVGPLLCEAERICRHSVQPTELKAYQPNRDFFLSYFTALVVEAAMHYFGMESRNSMPTKNIPPRFDSQEEQREWVYLHLAYVIDNYVFPCWSGNDVPQYVVREVRQVQQYVQVTLANGNILQIPLAPKRVEVIGEQEPDKVKDYMHYVLETGMIFSLFLSYVKHPERMKLLAVFKVMMLQLKGRSSKAKYPLELLRTLLQQYSLLPLREACQVLQSCFVNTRGKSDSHVPADHYMEWIVREEKRHVKHMFSNKTHENIYAKSAAIPAIVSIGNNFDENANVVKRCKAHKRKGAEEDELFMMDDFHLLKPFEAVEGRAFAEFGNIVKSQVKNVDGYKFHQWFLKHKTRVTP